MQIAARLSLLVVISAGIWCAESAADRRLMSAPIAGGAANPQAVLNAEVRDQRHTALLGAAIAVNFLAAVGCLAPWSQMMKPARRPAS